MDEAVSVGAALSLDETEPCATGGAPANPVAAALLCHRGHAKEPLMSSTGLADQITADSLVHEVIDRHPRSVSVFVQYRLQCIGCYISPFHTIEDVAREYALGLDPLLLDLNQAATAGA